LKERIDFEKLVRIQRNLNAIQPKVFDSYLCDFMGLGISLLKAKAIYISS
jgi:hypothetical protein